MLRLSLCLAAAALIPSAAAAQPGPDPIRAQVSRELSSLLTLYRELHVAPELSFQETKTAARLAAETKRLGFAVTTGVGKTGVVAVFRNGPGPVVLLRTDMDGLPVTEQTGLPYASKVRVAQPGGGETGVMHACGHDTHMSAWVGTARALTALKANWSGTLVMIAQPAEEIGSGARAMLADGLFTRFPKPDHVLAFHNSSSLPAGVIGYTPGYALANVDSVDLLVRGEGGHGAYPHLAKDPIVLASRIVTALQTLVSREIDPQDAAVVTVGSFNAGTKHNIIPPEARLQLTVRSYTPEVRQHLLDGIARIAKGEAIAAGIREDRLPVMTIKDENTPAVFNTQPLTDRVGTLFRTRLGEDRVRAVPPTMGGEDFSRYYLADKSVQSLIFWVGAVPQTKWDAAGGDVAKLPSIHSPFWAPDPEPTIATATEAMTAAALMLLGNE